MKNIEYIIDIKNNQLFNHLPDEELGVLLNQNPIIKYTKGGIIHLQNQPCNSLGLILDGEVAIQSLDYNGKVLTVVCLGAGESFGENLIFADYANYPMTISANSNATILHINKEIIIDLCQRDKGFLTKFVRSISNKALIISGKLNAVTLKTIREKIIDFLIQESVKEQSLHIKLTLNRKEWADSLGIPRPSLSRELRKMKHDGLIDYAKDWILVLDESLLGK